MYVLRALSPPAPLHAAERRCGVRRSSVTQSAPAAAEQDVVYLAGMKAVRQGTVNISLEATADGLWPALKAKVARVLHDRAAASVADDEEKQEFPRGA